MVAKYLREEEEIEWDPAYRQIFCISHVINLAVQAFLFQDVVEIGQLSSYNEAEAIEEEEREAANIQRQATFHIMGPLGKLHNIVTYICGSASYIKEFKDLAGRLILLDNYIRWNS